MNQGILLLLLAAVSNMQNSSTYGRSSRRGGDLIRSQRVDAGSFTAIKPQHMIRQMQSAIDVLQRVEQIGELADISGLRSGRGREVLHATQVMAPESSQSHSSGIRESLNNVKEYLSGESHEEDVKHNSGINISDLAGLAGLLGGGDKGKGGLDIEKLMKMVSMVSAINKK